MRYQYRQEDRDAVDDMSPEAMEAFCVEAEKTIKRRTTQNDEVSYLP